MARSRRQRLARAVFPHAARVAFHDGDQPLIAHDPTTGVDLSYRFEPHAGGTLRLAGGAIGPRTLAVGCDEADLELVAGLLLDGLQARAPRPGPR